MPEQKSTDLDVYLQYAQEGDDTLPDSNPRRWYVGSLAEGGHTTSLYGKTRQEIDERATLLLAQRGITV